MEKKCTKCGETKPLESFSKDRTKKDGLRPSCKECRKLVNRDYYLNNRDSIIQRVKEYSRENLHINREASRRYREANPEKRKAAYHRVRAKRRNARGTFTASQWRGRLSYHENKCYYWGSAEDLQIEHRIPLSRGGTNWPSNLVPACKTCNCRKHTKTELEFVGTIK